MKPLFTETIHYDEMGDYTLKLGPDADGWSANLTFEDGNRQTTSLTLDKRMIKFLLENLPCTLREMGGEE